MKILETQSAVLSNIEVLAHLRDVDARYAKHSDYIVPPKQRTGKHGQARATDGGKLRGLRSAVQDGIAYLASTPMLPSTAATGAAGGAGSDGADASADPDPEVAQAVVARLARFATLTKAEKLMIVNLRPADTDALEVIVEEADGRLAEGERREIVGIVAEAFGTG